MYCTVRIVQVQHYVYVGRRMHASLSTLKFSLDIIISISWDGANLLLALLARLAIYDNRNCGCFEEWSLCGCYGVGGVGTDALMFLHACSSSTLRISHLDQL